MARSKTPPKPEPEPPQVPAAQGIQLIETQIIRADELLQKHPTRAVGARSLRLVIGGVFMLISELEASCPKCGNNFFEKTGGDHD